MSCSFCAKTFVRESAVLSHMCEKKKRHVDRDARHVRLGFNAYLKFHHVNFPTAKPPTYDKFSQSRHYKTFIKFAQYLIDINAVEPINYADWIMRQGIAATKWTDDRIYETYIRELCKKESPERAVERSMTEMQKWAAENETHWSDCFRAISAALATNWIKSGRISPWVLYSTISGRELLGRLSEEQLTILKTYIDPNFWTFKFDRHRDQFSAIRDIFHASGV